jgi:hypothetical protein
MYVRKHDNVIGFLGEGALRALKRMTHLPAMVSGKTTTARATSAP